MSATTATTISHEQRNDDADDERQDETRREDQAHVCVAFTARAFQGYVEGSPELP